MRPAPGAAMRGSRSPSIRLRRILAPMAPLAEAGRPPASSTRFLVVSLRVVLVLVAAGLVKGAHELWTGGLFDLLPRLTGWQRALPAVGWLGTAVAVGALWCWRWWGLWLALVAAAFELAVELAGGGAGLHLLRIPTLAVLLLGLCLPLRERFRSGRA